MNNAWKVCSLVLLALMIASSLILVKSSSAQSTPSVPEFSVQYVNHPYDLAPTYTVDPYTGQTEVASHGGHFDNYTVEIKIKNQAFTSTIDQSGNQTSLYYNLRFKGHYEENWTYYPVESTDFGSAYHPVDPYQTGSRGSQYIDASNTDYTTLILPQWRVASIKQGGEVDVQVQALIGYDSVSDWGEFMGGELLTYYFEGQYTDWSSTQTVKIDDAAAVTPPSSPAPSSSAAQDPLTSTQPNAISAGGLPSMELLAFVALGVVVALLVVVVALLSRKIRVLERKLVG
jgi:hypothetical protein